MEIGPSRKGSKLAASVQKLAEIGSKSVEFAQSWSKSNNRWRTSGHVRSNSPKFGRACSKFGRSWANVNRTRWDLVESGPALAKLVPFLPKSGQLRQKKDELEPSVCRIVPSLFGLTKLKTMFHPTEDQQAKTDFKCQLKLGGGLVSQGWSVVEGISSGCKELAWLGPGLSSCNTHWPLPELKN